MAGRKKPPADLKVRNRIEYATNNGRGAELFRRILRAVREQRAERLEKEARDNGRS